MRGQGLGPQCDHPVVQASCPHLFTHALGLIPVNSGLGCPEPGFSELHPESGWYQGREAKENVIAVMVGFQPPTQRATGGGSRSQPLLGPGERGPQENTS